MFYPLLNVFFIIFRKSDGVKMVLGRGFAAPAASFFLRDRKGIKEPHSQREVLAVRRQMEKRISPPRRRVSFCTARKKPKSRQRGEGFRFPSPLCDPLSLNRPSTGGLRPPYWMYPPEWAVAEQAPFNPNSSKPPNARTSSGSNRTAQSPQ